MTKLNKITLNEIKVFKNLFNLFCHDLASYEFGKIHPKTGFYDFPNIKKFIINEGYYSYFIINNNDIAGFIVLSCPPCHSKVYNIIQQFFVLNGYRRKGIGNDAALKLLMKHPGKYALLQIYKNKPAVKFWRAFLNKNGISYDERKEKNNDEISLIQYIDYKR